MPACASLKTAVNAIACVRCIASQCTAAPISHSCLCQVFPAIKCCAGDLQTWVEGKPVKGKPAKPSRAAALQLLQQLATQHCQGACIIENPAALPSHTAAAPYSQDAGAAVSPQSVVSQPEVDIAIDSQTVQPRPQPAVDRALSDAESESEAEVSGGVESDSEAEINLRGAVASDEEDDKQGPGALAGPVTASAEGLEDQASPGESWHAADPEADLSSERALPPDCASASELTGVAGKQPHHASLSKVMQQQRQRMSKSQRKTSSQPEVVLALTKTQQQQWQPEGSQTCNTSENPPAAVVHECSSMSAQTDTAVLDAQPTSGHDRLHAQLSVHCTGQLVSEEDEEDEAGPSSKANGQDEHQLWQNLAEALQDEQSCQKLAQMTVTLLGRM